MTLPSQTRTAGGHHEPYFHHGDGAALPRPGVLQSVTRYLCGAAYVDERFADRVISELVEDEQRAVAPSYGFDLDPVVRHCFRARRLWLMQNAAVTAVLLVGLCFVPLSTISVLGLMLVVGVPFAMRENAGMGTWKKVAIGVAVLMVLFYLVPLVLRFNALLSTGSGLGGTGFGDSGLQSGDFSVASSLLQMLFVAVVMGGTLTWFRYTMLRTVAIDLKPDAPHTPPAISSSRVADRLEYVARSQRGNVVLHAGYNPFLGAGDRELRAWSVVVELRPSGGPEDRSDPTRDPVDPVALNRHVKQRLAALRSVYLPERQRVLGLQLRDYVVASGRRPRHYALVDGRHVPYGFASQAAVEAIIRHPQAGARHFLRATTGTEGKEVVVDGARLLPAEDQEVQVSAFVHIAVEGGMLYVEYVSTLMGAIMPRYHAIDWLPLDQTDLFRQAAMEALRRLTISTVLAPLNLIGGLVRMFAVGSRMNTAARLSREVAEYNYGARISVRSLASSGDADTYTRRLDAEKYNSLIERRVNDAVLDFLDSQQVDTSEYRMRVNVIMSQNQFIGSTFNGPVAAGTGATATANAAPAAPTARER